MPVTLSIEVTDQVWQFLRQTAEQQGKAPEAVAAECLANLTPTPTGGVRRWVGAWASHVPDASVRHDEYLGQALADKPRHD